MASQRALPGLSDTPSVSSMPPPPRPREPLPQPTTLELLVQSNFSLYDEECSKFPNLAQSMAIHLGDLFNVTDGYTAAEIVEYRHEKYLLWKLLPPRYDPRLAVGVLYPWEYKREQLARIAYRMLNDTTYTDLKCYQQEASIYTEIQTTYTDDVYFDAPDIDPEFFKHDSKQENKKELRMESIQWLRSHVGLAASPNFDGSNGARIESVVRLILREHPGNPLLECRYASDVVSKVNSHESMKDVYIPWTAIPYVLINIALKFNPYWKYLETWFDREVHDEQNNTDWISVFMAINGSNPNPPALPEPSC